MEIRCQKGIGAKCAKTGFPFLSWKWLIVAFASNIGDIGVQAEPAVSTWQGGMGLWSDPAKWIPKVPDGANDDAVIHSGAVTLDVDVALNTLTVNTASFVVDQARILSATSAFRSLTLDGLGSLTLTGETTFGTTGQNIYQNISAAVDNTGSVRLLGRSDGGHGLYSESENAVWTNKEGSSLLLERDGGLSGSSNAKFINEEGATLIKRGESLSSDVSDINWTFINNGTLEVEGGMLNLSNIPFGGTGTARVSEGARLMFGDVTLPEDCTLNLEGAVQFYNLSGPGKLTLEGGTIALSSQNRIYTAIDNAGSVRVADTSGAYSSNVNTVWTNKPGSSLFLDSPANLNGSSNAKFINEEGATLTKRGGGQSSIYWTLVNNGTLMVEGGKLYLNRIPMSGTGTVRVSEGALLMFNDVTLPEDCTLNLEGPARFNRLNGPGKLTLAGETSLGRPDQSQYIYTAVDNTGSA